MRIPIPEIVWPMDELIEVRNEIPAFTFGDTKLTYMLLILCTFCMCIYIYESGCIYQSSDKNFDNAGDFFHNNTYL